MTDWWIDASLNEESSRLPERFEILSRATGKSSLKSKPTASSINKLLAGAVSGVLVQFVSCQAMSPSFRHYEATFISLRLTLVPGCLDGWFDFAPLSNLAIRQQLLAACTLNACISVSTQVWYWLRTRHGFGCVAGLQGKTHLWHNILSCRVGPYSHRILFKKDKKLSCRWQTAGRLLHLVLCSVL